MDSFLITDKDLFVKTYQDFLDAISEMENVDVFYDKTDVTKLWLNFVGALIYNLDFTFLDANLSEYELEDINQVDRYIPIEVSKKFFFTKWDDLIERLKNSSSKITLFTSGTTGQPKRVIHSIQTLMRQVRIDSRFVNSKWGFTYSPTHIAGIQLFLQAFSNMNPIVDLFEKNKDYVLLTLLKTQLTHISGTPTFYRLLMPCNVELPSVIRVTIGGEKSNYLLVNSLSTVFPNARINNVYASTEAGSLFSSSSNGFNIPEIFKDLIKIEDNEIILHNSIIGGIGFNEEWFQTGDLIKWINEKEGLFEIISRKNEMINVGGNKVNPIEIEDIILKFENVKNVLVYGRPNAVLGQILVADIVLLSTQITFDEKKLKKYLNDKLQPFKIPRKIYYKENIEVGKTGKIKRI
jgi:acyl-coenzyme A synthetase/AMP-(fatty) acid ligase